MLKLSIVDYGSGNLRSVAKAFERVVAEHELQSSIQVINKADDVAKADHIVLPGVGAFGDCMDGLRAIDGMIDALSEAALTKAKPFLGICVGMQLLATTGHEFGDHAGLNWIPGNVLPLAPTDKNLKIPHMGWNTLSKQGQLDHPVLADMKDGDHVYFVHSNHYVPDVSNQILAKTEYSQDVTAIIGRDNLIATQFHPEKSQAVGLGLLRRFAQWKP